MDAEKRNRFAREHRPGDVRCAGDNDGLLPERTETGDQCFYVKDVFPADIERSLGTRESCCRCFENGG